VKRQSTHTTDPMLAAYGPEKQAWKDAGNYFSSEELREMERAFVDIKVTPCPEIVLSVD